MAVRRLWSRVAATTALRPARPLQEALHAVLEYAVLASHRRAFDPMESAIVDAGQRLLANTEHLHADWTLVDDYPLSREMLAMSRVWQSPDRRERLIAAKGAPEAIVDLCHLDAGAARRIAAQVAAMAGDGLRVLGVARATFQPRCRATSMTSSSSSSAWSGWRIRCALMCRRPLPSAVPPASVS